MYVLTLSTSTSRIVTSKRYDPHRFDGCTGVAPFSRGDIPQGGTNARHEIPSQSRLPDLWRSHACGATRVRRMWDINRRKLLPPQHEPPATCLACVFGIVH